ncbi:pilus assembly protein PilA [Pandoraea terrae]|uniref:Pilus assembly protein PilA n=1 Tax=Pandoraea terrae TaxID=1537710 RepID=A0A5E4VI31_9BURK|nr:Flp family type IVb pilin [Pandoraea terrae]VVE11947.1 pilus assembly protein PilA [Pandoraea terrae]
MQKTLNLIRDFLREEDGATAIEYGLLAALISVAIIIATTGVGNALNNVFNFVSGRLNGAVPA